MIFQLALIYFPALVFGFLFVKNYRKEPRQFRNALYFLLLCLFALYGLSIQFELPWLVLIGLAAIPFGTVALVVFLLANTFVVVKREGLSLSHLLPGLLALCIVMACVGGPVLLFVQAPPIVLALALLVLMEGSYVAFTFAALLLYSWLYRRLPKRRDYDYIVVHGAGLSGTKPTPLLAARLDKAVELWEADHRRAVIIASGGQGADEEVSEAEAMRTYLVEERGVPADAVIEENRSTTTMENLRNSKAIMDARSGARRVPRRSGDQRLPRVPHGRVRAQDRAGRRRGGQQDRALLLAHRVHPRIRGRQQRPPLAVRGYLRVLAPFRRHRAVPAVERFAPAPDVARPNASRSHLRPTSRGSRSRLRPRPTRVAPRVRACSRARRRTAPRVRARVLRRSKTSAFSPPRARLSLYT